MNKKELQQHIKQLKIEIQNCEDESQKIVLKSRLLKAIKTYMSIDSKKLNDRMMRGN